MSVNNVAWWLVVLGAISVGLAALGFDVVEMLLSSVPQLAVIVNLLIGVSGVYFLLMSFSGTNGAKRKKGRK